MPRPSRALLSHPITRSIARAGTFRFLRSALRLLSRRGLFLQLAPNTPLRSLLRLGSDYGGWVLRPDSSISQGWVISAGAGEDISFDIELLSQFDPLIVIVDPTPRAVEHVTQIIQRGFEESRCDYETNGKQPPDSYDLTGIDRSRIQLVNKALWTDNETLTLYAPASDQHVSYSAIRPNRNADNSIQVETVRIVDLVKIFGTPPVLVKLDIEGVACDVILDMLKEEIRPSQLLVEFDELLKPTKKDLQKVKRTHRVLQRHGYRRIYSDRWSNFLYVLET